MPRTQIPDPAATLRGLLATAVLKDVSEATGLTQRQLRNIRDNSTQWPRWNTMQALARYFKIRLGA